jgi:hypothetical protein
MYSQLEAAEARIMPENLFLRRDCLDSSRSPDISAPIEFWRIRGVIEIKKRKIKIKN